MVAVVIRVGHVMRLLLLLMMKTMQGSKRERSIKRFLGSMADIIICVTLIGTFLSSNTHPKHKCMYYRAHCNLARI